MPQPPPQPPHDVTAWVLELGHNRTALDQLVPVVYEELRRLAHRYLRNERTDHTIRTTDLVHEAYLNLVDQTRVNWQNRAHFLGVAAQAMRRILLMYARQRNALKRGGGQHRVPLTAVTLAAESPTDDLLALDEALKRLEELDASLGKIVELRYFGGLTLEETAEVIDRSPATVSREWRTAKAWLYRALK